MSGRPGPRNLVTDVAGLRVGNASDPGLKSGVTVLVADLPVTASVHVMGGAPGTRETDLLAPDKTVQSVDALVLAGGSTFGLDAAAGVMDGLAAMGRGFAVGPARVPIVPAAILFDLLNGGDKDWTANPYRGLGLEALHAAGEDFAIGSAGAGMGALTAQWRGGLGSASAVIEGGITVGALVAVNPVGCVTPSGRREFWAAPFEIGAEFGGLGTVGRVPPLAYADTKLGAANRRGGPGDSTTIAIVATDAALGKAAVQRMAVAAHDGLARAIVPSHTPHDGDLVFGLATGARPLRDPPADMLMIGHAAATCLARACARAVFAASPDPGGFRPAWSDGT